jgi:hypothetical protein
MNYEKVKTIHLKYCPSIFKELEVEKLKTEKLEAKNRKDELSWEDFVIIKCLGRNLKNE